MNNHHARQQLNYLRQSLADGKKPIGILLGAGCPMSVKNKDKEDGPLIPDIAGLTSIICNEAESFEACKAHLKNLLSVLKEDGLEKPNIEEILSRIRLLREAAGKNEVRGLTAEQLDDLDKEICERIVQVMKISLPDNNSPFHKLARWIGSRHRDFPIEIFTTNYDLLIEQALEECKVPYFDGFVGSRQTFFDIHAMEEDKLPSRWSRLWKLHGSINWRMNENKEISRGEEVEENQRRIIHPSHLKYSESRRMPYYAMLDRLRSFFKSPSLVLVTCGYSFRDQHINEIIIEGLQGNANAIVFGLLFGELNNYDEAIKLATERSNLTIFSREEAIIGTVRTEWAKMQEAEDFVSCAIVLAKESNEDSKEKKEEEYEFRKVKNLLGDFSIFGEFLEEMIWEKVTNEVSRDEK